MNEQRRSAADGHRRSFLRLMAIVARRDYLRTVRRRGFVFGTALLPLAIAGFAVLSMVVTPVVDVRPAPAPQLAVVNESSLQLASPAGVRVIELASSNARRALEQGQLREFYVLPAGYPDQATVRRIVAPDRSPGLDDLQRRTQQDLALAAVLRTTLLEAVDVGYPTSQRLLDPYRLEEISLDGQTPPPDFEAGFLLPYAFTFLFVMSIFITSGYLLQSVTEEKENRVVEIVLSSVPPQPLMAGKILGLGAAGLTQVVIWVATALIALPLVIERFPPLRGLDIHPLTLLLAVVFFGLGYLAYGAIFAAIGALAPGTREAQQYSGFFGFFAVIPLIFAGAFVADPASPLVAVLAIVPLTAPASMLQVLALSPDPPWTLVVASLASLTTFAVVASIVAARVFRATVLLYGVRPGMRRIVEAITARG
ncbi:MAG: ABC transporter permease [Chloroflexota bacterium]|nr:ABC transporter permease [Chloroflexota bacterium]